MNAATPAPSHVLFDLDGTLVDTREGILGAYRHAFETVGRHGFPTDADFGEVMKKRPAEALTDEGYGDQALAGAAAYDAWYRDHGSPLATLFPSVRELLDGLDAGGIPFGIVTNKGRERALEDLRNVDVDPGRLSVLVAAEDTLERKPHPAPVRLGAHLAGIASEQGVYVGDGPHDIVAARRAGLAAVAVTYGYFPRAALLAERPAAAFDDALELLAWLGLADAATVRSGP